MKPIYMSANYEQVDIIKTLLSEKGVDTKLIAKEDANNPLAPKGIIWFELWLKRQSDAEIAETAIEKYEFSQLKNSLKVTWEALHTTPPQHTKEKSSTNSEQTASSQNSEATPEKIAISATVSKDQREKLMRAAYENWLPVNNQKVFHRLASSLGFSDDEITNDQFNNIRRPWNADRLKSQVLALQQLCKIKPHPPAAAVETNSEIDSNVS